MKSVLKSTSSSDELNAISTVPKTGTAAPSPKLEALQAKASGSSRQTHLSALQARANGKGVIQRALNTTSMAQKPHNKFLANDGKIGNAVVAGSPEVVTTLDPKLSKNRLMGSKPGSQPLGWNELKNEIGRLKGKWVRFHLINQFLGGPGNNTNLVPTTTAINTGKKWRTFEENAKYEAQDSWIHLQVTVQYYPPQENNNLVGFPKQIFGRLLKAKFGKWMFSDEVTLNPRKPVFGGGAFEANLDQMGTRGNWRKALAKRNPEEENEIGDNQKLAKAYSMVAEYLDQKLNGIIPDYMNNVGNGSLAGLTPTLIYNNAQNILTQINRGITFKKEGISGSTLETAKELVERTLEKLIDGELDRAFLTFPDEAGEYGDAIGGQNEKAKGNKNNSNSNSSNNNNNTSTTTYNNSNNNNSNSSGSKNRQPSKPKKAGGQKLLGNLLKNKQTTTTTNSARNSSLTKMKLGKKKTVPNSRKFNSPLGNANPGSKLKKTKQKLRKLEMEAKFKKMKSKKLQSRKENSLLDDSINSNNNNSGNNNNNNLNTTHSGIGNAKDKRTAKSKKLKKKLSRGHEKGNYSSKNSMNRHNKSSRSKERSSSRGPLPPPTYHSSNNNNNNNNNNNSNSSVPRLDMPRPNYQGGPSRSNNNNNSTPPINTQINTWKIDGGQVQVDVVRGISGSINKVTFTGPGRFLTKYSKFSDKARERWVESQGQRAVFNVEFRFRARG